MVSHMATQEVSHSSGSRWQDTAAPSGRICCLALGCAGTHSLELSCSVSLPSMQLQFGSQVLPAVQGWGTSLRWTSVS